MTKQSRRSTKLLKNYNRASLKPIDADIWYNKAKAIKYRGPLDKFDESIRAYNKAIELNPKLLGAWNNKGWALFEVGSFSAAIQAYERALEIDPNDKQVWMNKHLALDSLSKHCESLGDYENAFKFRFKAQEAFKRADDQSNYICYTDPAFEARKAFWSEAREGH